APGQRLVVERELLHWVRLPEPGRYTLTLVTASSLGEARSAPVALEVVPLMLAHVAETAPTAGGGPLRYVIASHHGADGRGVVLVDAVNLTSRAKPEVLYAWRVAESGGDVRAIGSESARNHPIPAQWVLWTGGGQLGGVYVRHGLPDRAAASAPAGAGAMLLGPALQDAASDDGKRPARAEVALWLPGADTAQLSLRTLDDGRWGAAHDIGFSPGSVGYARAFGLGDGQRRLVMLLERGGD